jgi:hypothetical protein
MSTYKVRSLSQARIISAVVVWMLISLTMKMKREADELSIILPFFSKVEWE